MEIAKNKNFINKSLFLNDTHIVVTTIGHFGVSAIYRLSYDAIEETNRAYTHYHLGKKVGTYLYTATNYFLN